MKIVCPRCYQAATVTFTRRGTERIHAHKRADGTRCRVDQKSVQIHNDNYDEDGSPLDADNDPDS